MSDQTASTSEITHLLDAARKLADDLWTESQQDHMVIRDAGIVQDIVYRLRGALGLSADPDDAPLPPAEITHLLLPPRERAVAWAVGRALVWLGKRAHDRGDRHAYRHALDALNAGNCDTHCSPEETR